MEQEIISLVALIQSALPLAGSNEPILSPVPEKQATAQNQFSGKVLVEKTLDLEKRHPDKVVNEVFRDNILLNLHYLKKDVDSLKKDREKQGPENIAWEKAREPFDVVFILRPDESFAFHENILDEYSNKPLITGNSHFSYEDGYKTVAGLFGNGVCHLASLINWAASEAGLEVNAPTSHDFAPVPEVPRKYGTSILYCKDVCSSTQRQNLYLKNNTDKVLIFTFKVTEKTVVLKIQELS